MRLRFSTDDVPVAVRKDAVDAAFGAHARGTVDFVDGASPRIAIDLRALGSVHLACIDTSPIQVVTPPVEDGVVYLGVTAAGGGLMDAQGDGHVVRAGDLTVMQRDRRYATLVSESSRIFSIAIPRAQLLPRLANEECLATPNLYSRPAARLLEHYTAMLLADDSGIDRQDEAMLAGHVVDLAVMALGAKRDDAERAGKSGVRAARRAAIKADIAANLGLFELSLDWIARRHHVSGAYVRALFYDEGASFTDYVLGERLAHVHTMLSSPYLAHRTIAAIALMAGFGDISWFNQAFRRRFGETPSDVRARSAGE